jgi:hypothetical protein
MTTIDDGGPAYPGNHHDGKAAIGASLRDVFAMHAMAALLSPNHPWADTPRKVSRAWLTKWPMQCSPPAR